MYIVWTALNGVVLVYLFASCVYALRLVWQRLGAGPLVVLLFGLYAWRNTAERPASSRQPVAQRPAGATYAEVVTHDYYTIEDHYLNKLTLSTSYVERADTAVVLSAQTDFTDFHLGNQWQPRATVVSIQGKQLRYSVAGTMSWCLLGVPLYWEPKQLRGAMALR